jgi:hypothetical protein
MNKVKVLATLFIGIFIGYIITTFSSPNEHNENNSALVQQFNKPSTSKNQPNITLKDAPEALAFLPRPLVNKSKNLITQLSTSSHQTLEDEYQDLDKAYLQSKKKIASLQRRLDELDESDISTEQMEALVTEPFKNNISSFTGTQRNEIYSFHQEEDDLDWGYNMQNYISDFVLTHYNSNEINLVSVICKQQSCELLIAQHVDGTWQKIAQDLGDQTWWKFRSSSSTSNNYPGSDNALAIYTFLSL